ncbi:MAG: DUF418 domain-containing protein [Phycisphaerales bacterium JB040]
MTASAESGRALGEGGARPAPVSKAGRIGALDVVRGFALLGILGPNIVSFAWPSPVMYDHGLIAESMRVTAPGDAVHAHANRLAEEIVGIFFFGKMMFLFSLLFGAGVVMYGKKFLSGETGSDSAAGGGGAGGGGGRLSDGWWLWYRRMGWLLAFGLLHGVLFWYGDILVWYAVCGLGVVWWARKLSARWLLLFGGGIYLVGTLVLTGLMALWMLSVSGNDDTMAQAIETEAGAYLGSYWEMVRYRAVYQLLLMYLLVLPFGFFWLCTGIMLLGMGLTRNGVLTGARSLSFYAWLAALGLGVGLYGTILVRTVLDEHAGPNAGMLFQGFGQFLGIPTSLGYMAILILLVKLGALRPLTGALASVGRMALTNYLLQTVICTTLFYTHGLGWYGTVQYPDLWLVMVGVWGVNIVVSVLWLRWFRFGPMEWLWRSLTYWKPQPMLRRL